MRFGAFLDHEKCRYNMATTNNVKLSFSPKFVMVRVILLEFVKTLQFGRIFVQLLFVAFVDSIIRHVSKIVSLRSSFSVWGRGRHFFEYYYTAIAC